MSGQNAASPQNHEEYLALCALSTTGELSTHEQRRLQEHLLICDQCREATQDFERLVGEVIPVIGAERFEDEHHDADVHWLNQAETQFFNRLALEKAKTEERPCRDSIPYAYGSSFSGIETWRNIWALSLAGLLLATALGLSVYQLGTRKGFEVARSAAQLPLSPVTESLGATKQEREIAQAQAKERDTTVNTLIRQLRQQSAELNRLKIAQRQLTADLSASNTDEEDLIAQRNELLERMDAAQIEIQRLELQIESARSQESQDSKQNADLQARAAELTRLLKERDNTIAEDEELLAHDRDIRELIGSRELHVAEVYDVARNGQTQKPYGRVFFTRGKSLVFYAYDLDQVQEKSANIFQAWGRSGSDRKQALNLGIFYKEDASKKRWILRFDDPKTLAQIDAVFVTVEPSGRSREPSGKPLLFAYLNGDPNHP